MMTNMPKEENDPLGDLKRQLHHENAGQRQLAVKQLASEASAEARGLIIDRLTQENDPEVLEWLCIGAGHLKASEASEAIRILLEHPIGDVRRFACEALGKIGDETCLADLQNIANNDEDRDARLAAIQALGQLPKAAAGKVQQALFEIQQQNTGDVAQAAGTEAAKVHKQLQEQAQASPPPLVLLDVPIDPPKDPPPKDKHLRQLAEYLQSHGVDPAEREFYVKRNRLVVRRQSIIKQRKAGDVTRCELCGTPFFATLSGGLHCEMAHIQALSEYGPDCIENTLLLCDWCHAQLDLGRDTEVCFEEGRLRIRLPSGIEYIFQIVQGQPPQRVG
jgi:hypothetical protein